jgi:hypothetical protein
LLRLELLLIEMPSAALVFLRAGTDPIQDLPTVDRCAFWAMWLYETPKVGEMDMAMLAVQEMPPSSASSFWIARVSAGWVTQQRRCQEVADFVHLHGFALSR